jgi:glycosyltransferase involved in cell wall biosynthesis
LAADGAFDLVHADQLWMAPYALKARQAAAPRPPKLVLDQHNAVYLIPRRLAETESNLFKQQFLAREAGRLAAYETEVCRRFDHVVWVTAEDRQAVGALSNLAVNGQKFSTVIPICADPAHIPPVESVANRPRITFMGGLHWPPNAQGVLWFFQKVFPQIREAVPEAVLTVIGKTPPSGLVGEGVEVTGYVVDPLPYLTETAVFIVPLHAGGGMRVKILDAWSWGLPIVSTTIGAEGIETEPEKNILIADTAEAFAQAVIRILNDPTLTRQLGQNGRQTVLEKYNWQVTYSAWDKVYSGLFDNQERAA